jgi:hypothetical protein
MTKCKQKATRPIQYRKNKKSGNGNDVQKEFRETDEECVCAMKSKPSYECHGVP